MTEQEMRPIDPKVKWMALSAIGGTILSLMTFGGYVVGWKTTVAQHAIRDYAIDDHLKRSEGLILDFHETQKLADENNKEVRALKAGMGALIDAQRETNENLRDLVKRVDLLLMQGKQSGGVR
jgi:hypothetical protein